MHKFDEFYIMGAGVLGNHIKQFFTKNYSFKILGLIDNNANGDNIFKPENIEDKSKPVIIASINYMYEMYKQLKSIGFTNIINFGELTLLYPELQAFNQAFLGLKTDYEENKKEYDKFREQLADDKSKNVLDTIIEFRKTFNIELYHNIADKVEMQYFEHFMPKDFNVFVDGGGYDGDTVQRMFSLQRSPLKTYFFEPDKISIEKAKYNLKKIKGIIYYQYGLSDCKKTLKFDNRGDSGSCLDEHGTSEIQCVALDDIVNEDKAYIKLDIGGAEIDAINGAKRLIRNGSPYAICVYHKPSDIWKIPKLLNELTGNNSKGKYMLRHYTNTIFETVLYGNYK